MKTAGRLEPVGISDAFPFLTLPETTEGNAKPASSLISLEGETVVAQEPATHARGIQSLGPQIRILPPARWVRFDLLKELLDPFGRCTMWLHGIASPAGAITSDERIAHGRIELDVLAKRFFRRAGWAAENAGGSDGGEEYAIERRIALGQRAVHRVTGGKRSHHAGEFRAVFRRFHRKMNTEFGTIPVTA
jgi:hypothetical protein